MFKVDFIRLNILRTRSAIVVGFDIKRMFDDHDELKTKVVTVDRHLSCSKPIKKTFFRTKNFQVKMKYVLFALLD